MKAPLVETLGSQFNRKLLLASVGSLQEAAQILEAMEAQFVLFVAADTRAVAAEEVEEFARRAVQVGMAYACAWGPDCDRVEVAVDLAYVAAEDQFTARPGWSEDDTLLTSAHRTDTLDEALFFAVWCAFPTEAFNETTSVLALVVGNAEWTQVVRARLQAPESLLELVE
jgi:hypothetical protein